MTPLKFGTCHLLCLGGVQYNFQTQVSSAHDKIPIQTQIIMPVEFQEFKLLEESLEEEETKIAAVEAHQEEGQQTGGEEELVV